MLFLQQTLDGLDPLQIIQRVDPAIGGSPRGFEAITERFFPVTQGGLAHPGEMGNLFDGKQEIVGNLLHNFNSFL